MRLFLSAVCTFPSQAKVFNDMDFSLLIYANNSSVLHNMKSDSDVDATESVYFDSNSAMA
jgi:hypothetical protein